MSEMGEYWAEKRLKDQVKKLKQLNWNSDVVMHMATEYGFQVKQHTEHHMAILHPERGWMNYWPSTGKAQWRHQSAKPFDIKDIEAYLMKHFTPKTGSDE